MTTKYPLEPVVLVDLLIAALGLGAVWAVSGVRVIKQYERGLVFRFGRVRDGLRGPGLTALVPGADRLRRVNMQIVTMPVPAQDGITRDNVTVKVDAVVYFKVVDPVRVVVDVQDYRAAVGQVAQTSLRSIIGKSDLDDLLSNRERLNQGLELMIDSPALGWGVAIDRVEIKDVALPETMKRSMSRQAEAERERRARVISADGELQREALSALCERYWNPVYAFLRHRGHALLVELDDHLCVAAHVCLLVGMGTSRQCSPRPRGGQTAVIEKRLR